MTSLNSAKAKLAKAREIDPNHPSVKKFSGELDRHENLLLSETKSLYAQAKGFISAEEWLKDYFTLQQVQSIFPNYEDSFQLMSQTSVNGSQALYN